MQKVDNIKKATIVNTAWKFMERVLAQMISLVVSIVLARLLGPDDYSVVGIVGIFFNFANVIISGGFNTALIQKKNADKEDYSTVMFISVSVSMIIYGIIFFAAPSIARIYDKEILVPVFRVMALSLPIYAVKSIYCAHISANLQFKKFFWATIGGTIASAVVGIVMALNGFGAWALVAQQMTNTVIDTVILLLTTRLPLVLKISFSRLKSLFNYGWKVFASSVLGVVSNEAVPLFIGIKFTPESLSFYTKGKRFPALVASTATSTLSAVLFPVLSKVQDEKERLLAYTRRYISISSYFVFPLMLGFLAVSDNFVIVLLTEKWLPASFYVKVFCISCMFDLIHEGNCETIKAMGRSDVFLIMEIIKKTSYFMIIALAMFLGKTAESLALSSLLCTLVAIIVNTVPNIKLIGYSVRSQLSDLLPNLIISVIMCISVLLVGKINASVFAVFALQVAVGVVMYIFLSIVTKNKSFKYIIDLMKSRNK